MTVRTSAILRLTLLTLEKFFIQKNVHRYRRPPKGLIYRLLFWTYCCNFYLNDEKRLIMHVGTVNTTPIQTLTETNSMLKNWDPTSLPLIKPGFRIRIDLMRIRIRIRKFLWLRIRIPDPDPGLDDLKLGKIYSWKFNFDFLHQKLLFTYP